MNQKIFTIGYFPLPALIHTSITPFAAELHIGSRKGKNSLPYCTGIRCFVSLPSV